MARDASSTSSGLTRLANEMQRISDSLRRCAVLTPKEAEMLTRIPIEELPSHFKNPVLLKTYQVGGKTRRRLGYRLSDLEAHVERRVLQ